jgi:4-hydroxy-2-oxoglutarate aldolase
MNLAGIFAPLTTPFDAEGRILLQKLTDNIERLNLTGLAGFAVLGSTGETLYLSRDEKIEIFAAVREAAAESKLLLAGTAEESLQETVAMTRRVAEMGYNAVLVRTPHYYKAAMTLDAQRTFYRMVADASPIPVLIYNFPQVTGVDLPADVVAELAEHPNIFGIKESSGSIEKVTRMIHLTAHLAAKSVVPGIASRARQGLRVYAGQAASASRPDVIIETVEPSRPTYKDKPIGFQVLLGNAGTLYPALCAGATGAVLGLANAAPVACLNVVEAFRDGEHGLAREEQERMLEASACISQMSVAAVKYAMDVNGYYGGPPRLPMLPLTAAQRQRVEAAFRPLPR